MKKHSLLSLFLFCMCTFLFCILVTVAPLNRLAGTTQFLSLPVSMFLTVFGTKLPTDLHLTTDVHASQVNTDSIEFLVVMAFAYLFYSLSVYIVHKYGVGKRRAAHPRGSNELLRPPFNGFLTNASLIMRCIWIGAILAGVIYVLTPSVLSHDSAVYAGYGRVIVIYHANPYYTPLSAFPQDPFFLLDDWRGSVAAYGPLWLLVCAISTFVAGSSILYYIFLYRMLGLIAHLLNIWLVTTILRETKHSSRLVVLGTFLYAWNPLVLLESCLGGHNDIVMVSCMLFGILLSVRAEQRVFAQAHYYLPPVVAFTCAALIKFTAAPMLLFYLILIARRIFTRKQSSEMQAQISLKRRWMPTLQVVTVSALASCLMVATMYIPLWLGHSIHDIAESLGSPPSSSLAFGSVLLALQRVSLHEGNAVLAFLSLHSTWNAINMVVVGVLFFLGGIWIYRTPTTLTMVQVTLALLGGLLIVTPWFFPWYVIWLVGLAALCVSTHNEPVKRALVGSTLVFSASALFIYLFRAYPPVGDWIGYTSLTTIGPPLVVMLFLLFTRKNSTRTFHSTTAKPAEKTTNQLVP